MPNKPNRFVSPNTETMCKDDQDLICDDTANTRTTYVRNSQYTKETNINVHSDLIHLMPTICFFPLDLYSINRSQLVKVTKL